MYRSMLAVCALLTVVGLFPSDAVANDDPEITSFSAQQVFGDWWSFTGMVLDEDPGSCIVHFGGMLSTYTTVAADGTFQLIAEILLPGIVTATAEDAQSNLSNAEEVYVEP